MHWINSVRLLTLHATRISGSPCPGLRAKYFQSHDSKNVSRYPEKPDKDPEDGESNNDYQNECEINSLLDAITYYLGVFLSSRATAGDPTERMRFE